MPYAYPPAAPTISGDFETISRFLNSPTLVQRALRTLAQNRFVADRLLTAQVPTEGGALLYEQNESIFTDRPAEAIEPGGQYPVTTLGVGPALIAAVKKWGLQTPITDEAIRRLRMNPVTRGMTKIVNGVVKQVDTVALTAISATVTQTFAAPTAWTSSTRILRDILTAKATILALNQGYDPDVVVIDDLTWAILAADPTIANSRAREDKSNPVYTGDFAILAGLEVLPTPNLPVAGVAFVADSKVLGGMGNEVPLTSSSIRDENLEKWDVRAKRITTPFVQEPAAAIKITGI